jgi:acetoacetyl-CoA synthetase
MTRADDTDVPTVVWEPAAEYAETGRIGAFLRWLERERGLSFDGYDELWRWSVEELEDFWESVWHFFALPASASFSAVLDSRAMPKARWFNGARLNYAEVVLADPDAGPRPRERWSPQFLSAAGESGRCRRDRS